MKKLRPIITLRSLKFFFFLFKVNDRVRITKYKNIFSKGYTENWSRKTFIINSALKTNRWTYKLKDLNGDTIIGSFYEEELLLSVL